MQYSFSRHFPTWKLCQGSALSYNLIVVLPDVNNIQGYLTLFLYQISCLNATSLCPWLFLLWQTVKTFHNPPPSKKKKKNMHAVHARATFLGGWINWNMVSDVYIFKKGKSNNPAKNENVELTHTQVFCGWLCAVRIIVTKDELCWCHGQRSVQNADQTGYKILPEVLICNLATYRVLLNRICAIIFHDYLHYYGLFLSRFLICIFFNKATTVFWSLTKRPQSFLLEFQAFMESFSIRALDVSND